MKIKLLFPLGLALAIVLTIVSCQKETSYEVNNNNSGNSGNSGSGGAVGSSAPGWAFTHGTVKFGGCIDTSFYDQSSGIKVLTIEGSETAANTFMIMLATTNGKFSAGTYTPAQGASMVLQDNQGNAYVSGSGASSFSFTITSITDTSIKGTFTATLTDGGTNSYSISSGSIYSLIGKSNPCSIVAVGNGGSGTGGGGTGSGGGSGGGGTGSGGSTGTSVFNLGASGSDCSNVVIGGIYNTATALTSTNTVSIQVTVTKTGTWSLSSATADGFQFSGSGNFTTTGAQNIVLTGSGTPTSSGVINFPIQAGNTECSFNIPVIESGTPSCTPADNSADFSGVNTFNFYYVAHDPTSSFGGYTIKADGNGGGIELTFAGPKAPTPGVYHVVGIGQVSKIDDVALYAVASNVLWQSSSGNVYVTVNNGKVTAVMCSVPASGSLGGPSFTTKITAKMTEQ
jgi:Beta-propeller domains of methanol dehydrogenase type